MDELRSDIKLLYNVLCKSNTKFHQHSSRLEKKKRLTDKAFKFHKPNSLTFHR
jgi:hypothetical protein